MSPDENQQSQDPRVELQKLRDSGALSMGTEKPENYSIEAARTLLAICDLRTSNDRQFEVAFDKIDKLTDRVRGVEEKQVIANGSVGTLKAKVEIIEKERLETAKKVVGEVLESRVKSAAVDGAWIIPKPSWKTWTIIGGIFMFFGVDKIVHAIAFIGSMLAKLNHFSGSGSV